MLVMGVNHGVAATSRNQPAVDRIRGERRDEQGDCQASPEQPRSETGMHCARNEQHHAVVDDFHDRDRSRVRRERKTKRFGQGHAGPQQRNHRERETEYERQRDRRCNSRRRAPAQGGADDQAQHFPDAATREAMQRGAQGKPVQAPVSRTVALISLMVCMFHAYKRIPTCGASQTIVA